MPEGFVAVEPQFAPHVGEPDPAPAATATVSDTAQSAGDGKVVRVYKNHVAGGAAAPVLAEYGHGSGRVIVTTITLEYAGQYPAGTGQAQLLTNLFAYALSIDKSGRDEKVDRRAECCG